ncbi:Hypothetical predicted protein [Olea europaea subsp. europaea]|uniref:Uncharacterized protein n=1 Tax=Olea europaea subsp. europaea TaxID=158383 RepID=A0A8S0TAX3_OLEEU|nr:Hypothetical predicted protein [Olea europaea subsp. europaea]
MVKVESSITDEVIDAFKVRHAEAELRLGLLSTENEDLNKEVHLCKAGKVVVIMYLEHFHETVEYDGLDLYWKKVAYVEVLKMMAELHP